MNHIVQHIEVAARRAGQPEYVFLNWLLTRPAGTNLSVAAEAEIQRLSRYSGGHPGPRQLALLFGGLRNHPAENAGLPS